MSQFTVFPARELHIIVQHDAIGGGQFCRQIDKALLQLLAGPFGCDVAEFKSREGVQLTIIPVKQIRPEEVRPDENPGKPSDLPNHSVELAYQAVSDTEDSLDAIRSALQDGDYSEALRLVNLAHESLTEHVESLRSLL